MHFGLLCNGTLLCSNLGSDESLIACLMLTIRIIISAHNHNTIIDLYSPSSIMSFGPALIGMMSGAKETGSTFLTFHVVSEVRVICNS